MEEQDTARYSYKFSFNTAKQSEMKDEADKAEVQSYINELLGLDSKGPQKNKISV